MDITADMAIETFQTAMEENQRDMLRQNQVIHLPAEGELWIAGDLHDNRRNLDKLLHAIDLPNNPHRFLVLQELIHGDHYDADGAEDSWRTLLRAAELKCDYAEQVFIILANHDLAQVHGKGIMKAGLSVCDAFNKGIKKAFAPHHHSVQVAITEFLLSLPLAVRAPNGLFCCHSLPQDDQLETFDYSIFDRQLTGPDYARKTGPVYQLIWGRHTSAEGAASFAAKVGAKVLVAGHQPQESGFGIVGDHQLILASDHNQGVFLTADLAKEYDLPALIPHIRKFVAVELD